MQSEPVKFEMVFDDIQHLQIEKGRFEDTLRELRQKRARVEDLGNIVSTERARAANRCAKSAETLKMVQNRVVQTQAQLNNLREVFDRKNKGIKQLQAEMEAEKKKQLEEADTFDSQLEAICNKIKGDWTFYSATNIEQEMTAARNQMNLTETETSDAQNTLELAKLELAKLQLEHDELEARRQAMEIPAEVQQQMQKMMHKEQLMVTKKLQMLVNSHHALKTKLNQLDH